MISVRSSVRDTQGRSRVPELGPLGSMRGASSNGRPYREISIYSWINGSSSTMSIMDIGFLPRGELRRVKPPTVEGFRAQARSVRHSRVSASPSSRFADKASCPVQSPPRR